MKLRYKYRVYPTPDQEQQMTSVGGSVRFLYNHFLKLNIDTYQQTKKFVWYVDMCAQLKVLKEQHPWLKETSTQVLQQSLKNLDTALGNMKKTGAGFPVFKSKYTTPVSFRFPQSVIIRPGARVVYLPKIGDVRIRLHRALPDKYTAVTVIQTPKGWYASFVVDIQEAQLVADVGNPVGVDVNSEFTGLSTGELIGNPRPLRKRFVHIKNQQRKLSRKQKSSKNSEKQKLRLARVHMRVRCQRLDHIHQTSARIAKAHDLVSVETLKIEEIQRKSKPAAKAVADAGWAMLASAISYKCQLKGHHFIKISQWLPSSKTCSTCGHKKAEMNLRQREYHCDACGYVGHRDLNAAVNIRNWGHQQWNNAYARQELPEAPVDVTWDTIANWRDVSQSQLKQETVGL
jgi:putative transposase